MEEFRFTRENAVSQYFNPDDLSRWQDTTPQGFIANIVHEMMEDKVSIEKLAELLSAAPEMKSVTWTAGEETVTANFWLEGILDHARALDILIRTLNAYGKAKLQEEK